jgi:hypothetical protein
MTPLSDRPSASHFRGRFAPPSPAAAAPTAATPEPSAPVQPSTESAPSSTTHPAIATGAAIIQTGAATGHDAQGSVRNVYQTEHTQPPPLAALLAGTGLLVAVAALALVISQRHGTGSRALGGEALVWKASCGSPPVSGSSWWPVLGPEQAVETVRSRYCGDAYLTADGATQVASFASREEAAAFSGQLSRESGYEFRVGQPRTP